MRVIDPELSLGTPSRRYLLRGSAALGALAGLGVPRAARGAGEARTLRTGYIFGRDSQIGAGAADFARSVEAGTHGAWQIEIHPNAVLGGEVEMLDGLRRGEIDVAFVTAGSLAGTIPELALLDLPFLFRDASHAHAVLDGPIGRYYLDQFRELGLIALAWGENGVKQITNAVRPVRTPEDLRGLRLGVPQSEVTLRCFRQLGVGAVPLGFSALYGALESGAIDGQDNPVTTVHGSHFERVQRYLTLTGHVYSSALIILCKEVWDNLNAAERDVFTEAAVAGGILSRGSGGQDERDAVEALRLAGMEVVPFVDRGAFRAALEPVWSELAQQFGEDRIARIGKLM